MRFTLQTFEALDEAQIEQLRANGVRESRTLEYKRELPGGNADERKEFLQDVSALGNTDGGLILYGVETGKVGNRDTGIPVAIPGLEVPNLDAVLLDLQARFRTSTDPALTQQVRCRFIPLASGRHVLAIYVWQSALRPHRITFQGSNRFWRRNDAGNYEPATNELRAMFQEAREWTKEVEAFRSRRVALLQGARGLALSVPSALLHILPLGRLEERHALPAHEVLRKKIPTWDSHNGGRFNLDGYLIIDHTSGVIRHWSQVFRFGGWESFTRSYGREGFSGDTAPRSLFIADQYFETLATHATHAVQFLEREMNVSPPMAVCVTLVHVEGAEVPSRSDWRDNDRFDERTLTLPTLLLDDPKNTVKVVHELADLAYQAIGWEEAPATAKPDV